MADAARAVRIRRAAATPPGAEAPLPGTPSDTPVLPTGRRRPNRAGGQRAFRTFLVFVVGLAAIYALFLAYDVAVAPAATEATVSGFLTVSVVLALAVGWWVTLGQTPTVAWVERGELVVRERTGRLRRFPTDDLRIHVLRPNGSGLLGPEPTEFVELSVPGGPRRTYLVGARFFDFAR
jgi:hypothetical protein